MRKKVLCIVFAAVLLLMAVPTFAEDPEEKLRANFNATILKNSFYTSDMIWRKDNTSSVTYRWDSPIHAKLTHLTGPIKLRPVNKDKVVMGPETSIGSVTNNVNLFLTRTTYKHIRLKVINDNNHVNVECTGEWWGTYHD